MENQTPVPVQKKVGIQAFFAAPNVSKFLQETLKDKKSEFVSNMIALTDSDKNLAECDPAQLMKCALNATALNLPLNKNLGFAYVIAYKGIPSFQIGYKGLIQIAIRTGMYKTLNACEVRKDEISRNKITGEITFHGENPQAEIVGYIAYLELKSGFSASLYMSEAEIEAHALRFSQMYKSDKQYKSAKSKWSDPAARPKMALKTVIKGLIGTWGVVSTEIAKAFESDDNEEKETSLNRSFTDAEITTQTETTQETTQAKLDV